MHFGGIAIEASSPVGEELVACSAFAGLSGGMTSRDLSTLDTISEAGQAFSLRSRKRSIQFSPGGKWSFANTLGPAIVVYYSARALWHFGILERSHPRAPFILRAWLRRPHVLPASTPARRRTAAEGLPTMGTERRPRSTACHRTAPAFSRRRRSTARYHPRPGVLGHLDHDSYKAGGTAWDGWAAPRSSAGPSGRQNTYRHGRVDGENMPRGGGRSVSMRRD